MQWAVGYTHRKPRLIDLQLLGKEVWVLEGFWKGFGKIESRDLLEAIRKGFGVAGLSLGLIFIPRERRRRYNESASYAVTRGLYV